MPSLKHVRLNNSSYSITVDEEDFDRIKSLKWNLMQLGTICSTIRITGKQINITNFIMRDSKMYDHKDRNIFNCSKENLREATKSQNSMNTEKVDRFKPCSSKFKGVSYIKKTNKYRAYITLNKITKNLGHYTSELDAAKAYNKAAIQLFKDFACLNEVD